jgi:hypothetical protein
VHCPQPLRRGKIGGKARYWKYNGLAYISPIYIM